MNNPNCPGCAKPLQKVRQSANSMLNAEQFDAARAGDWFCETCPGDQARTGYRYFWDKELALPAAATPPRVSEQADERALLRAEQAAAVMPLIGPMLDAFEGIPNDFRADLIEEAPGLYRHIKAISAAMIADSTEARAVLTPVAAPEAPARTITEWDALLYAKHPPIAPEAPASEQQAHDWCKCGDDRKPAAYHGTAGCWLAATTASASDVQAEFESWANSHGGLPLDRAGNEMCVDGWLHFPTYKFQRTEIAWRAWANRRAPVPSREAAPLGVREALQLMVDRFGPCESEYLFSKRDAIQKARAALAQQGAAQPCPHCDDTGDVHRADGEEKEPK